MPCVTNIDLIFIKISLFSMATVSDKTYFNYHKININKKKKRRRRFPFNIKFEAQYKITGVMIWVYSNLPDSPSNKNKPCYCEHCHQSPNNDAQGNTPLSTCKQNHCSR